VTLHRAALRLDRPKRTEPPSKKGEKHGPTRET
jgi:hypothetical protein